MWLHIDNSKKKKNLTNRDFAYNSVKLDIFCHRK